MHMYLHVTERAPRRLWMFSALGKLTQEHRGFTASLGSQRKDRERKWDKKKERKDEGDKGKRERVGLRIRLYRLMV